MKPTYSMYYLKVRYNKVTPPMNTVYIIIFISIIR